MSHVNCFSRVLLLLLGSLGIARGATDPAITCLHGDTLTGASGAVIVDDLPLVHTAQLLPLDRHSALVGEKDASKQAEQVLANLASIFTAANSGLARTIKLNVYLARPEAMPAAQQVLARQFNGALKPAVSFVVGELP